MQNSSHLLMIQPFSFCFNAETAVNNSFQKDPGGNIRQKALQEFSDFVELLRTNKIDVTVVEDTPEPPTPDSIFPNNWISFHDDGSIFLYPMFAVNRRRERKEGVFDAIKKNFVVSAITDLSMYEEDNVFLEGTGSMVLDRVYKIAYACISPRTNKLLLDEFCKLAGFSPLTFRASDSTGVDIYHTNVMMCVAGSYVVVCLESITAEDERKNIIASFERTNKEIIDISQEQLNSFAGNMLQVKNADGELLLIMSTQAFQSLTSLQIEALEKYNRILHSSLTMIETAGGGSARCMMAEVFLKRK
jgi:hypothetical protein